MNHRNENAPELGGSRGGANMADRNDIIVPSAIHRNLYLTDPIAWRRATGLKTRNDLGDEYAACRRPRGNYRVPLPEDLCDGR